MQPLSCDIVPLFDPRRVVVLPGRMGKPLAIASLADLATGDLPAHDRIAFIRGALEREDVASTGIGHGVAIPHARTPALASCRIAIGVLPDGVDWGAGDGQRVHLAILIAACESDHAGHLRVMAALAVRLRRPGLVDSIRGLTDPERIIAAVRG